MHRKVTMLFVALALLVTTVLGPTGSAFVSSAQAAPPVRNGLLTDIPVTGTVPGGTFAGVLDITGFALNAAGDLVANGTLVGTTTIGSTTTAINQTFSAVVADLTNNSTNACDILFLDLGPLNLNVLGLVVDLSQITLDIDAVRGPGNLLGNLLCAVAGLLDGGGPLSRILGLLDRINDLLG